jgi:hypothetical protein
VMPAMASAPVTCCFLAVGVITPATDATAEPTLLSSFETKALSIMLATILLLSVDVVSAENRIAAQVGLPARVSGRLCQAERGHVAHDDAPAAVRHIDDAAREVEVRELYWNHRGRVAVRNRVVLSYRREVVTASGRRTSV